MSWHMRAAVALALGLAGCKADNSAYEPAVHPVKIGVISDVHIFDQSVLGGAPGQSAFDEAIAKDRKSWIQSPAILDAAIDKVVAAGNKILLITGDLTKDGEQATMSVCVPP